MVRKEVSDDWSGSSIIPNVVSSSALLHFSTIQLQQTFRYALSFVLQQLVAPPANSNSPVLADDDGALEELAGEDGADGNVEDLVAAHGCCCCCGCGCGCGCCAL